MNINLTSYKNILEWLQIKKVKINKILTDDEFKEQFYVNSYVKIMGEIEIKGKTSDLTCILYDSEQKNLALGILRPIISDVETKILYIITNVTIRLETKNTLRRESKEKTTIYFLPRRIFINNPLTNNPFGIRYRVMEKDETKEILEIMNKDKKQMPRMKPDDPVALWMWCHINDVIEVTRYNSHMHTSKDYRIVSR
jgi:DNA-directed RNA polymerase subunit H (RpoH/RPB5)